VFPVRGGGASNRFNLGRRLQHIVRVATELRRARTQASLPSHITPHTLRRTFITISIQAGRDLVFVQTQAGHADWKTTLEIYTQQSVRSIEPTIRQLLEHLLGEEESPTRARLLERSDILDGT
jgi:integrase